MNLLIKDVKCSIKKNAVNCGIIPDSVVVSIEFDDGTGSQWIHNIETEGIPEFLVTKDDVHQMIMEHDLDDEVIVELVEKSHIDNFYGINMGDYDDVSESMKNVKDNDIRKLVKSLVYVTRCSLNELDDFINYLKGKKTSAIQIEQFEDLL